MSLPGALALTIFPLLMAYAAFSDLFTMTISNRIAFLLVIGFVSLAALMGMPLTMLALHLAAGIAVLVLTFVLFARGWIGGGDAKLAAATAVWLGWDNLAAYGLQASLLGAGLTLGILVLRKRELPVPPDAPRLDRAPSRRGHGRSLRHRACSRRAVALPGHRGLEWGDRLTRHGPGAPAPPAEPWTTSGFAVTLSARRL